MRTRIRCSICTRGMTTVKTGTEEGLEVSYVRCEFCNDIFIRVRAENRELKKQLEDSAEDGWALMFRHKREGEVASVYSKGGDGVKWKVIVEDIEEAGGEQ